MKKIKWISKANLWQMNMTMTIGWKKKNSMNVMISKLKFLNTINHDLDQDLDKNSLDN